MRLEPKKLIMPALLLLIITACVPRLKPHKFLPDIIQVASPNESTDEANLIADGHYIRPTEFFIGEELATKGTWVYTRTAKMLKAAADDKSLPEFQVTMDSTQVFTSHYAKTRVARAEELSPGMEVFFIDIKDENGIYRSPLNPLETHSAWWINGYITEVTPQFVIASDGMKIHKSALRVRER